MASASVLKFRIGALHGISLAIWAVPQLALAQQAVTPGTQGAAQVNSASSDSDNSLEEIVIIAERRKENLQDAPITITAVSAAALESAGVRGTTELANAVSGLTMPQSQGTPLPHIRGVGNTAIGTGIENSVALYVDGVYRGSASFSALTFNNIAQLEVAKGPQGTLFGRNATGGLIQVITVDPQPGFSGSVDLGYGNFNTLTQDLYVTGGSDRVAGDFAFESSQQLTGWGTNVYNGTQVNRQALDLSARSKWLFNPAEGTAIRVIFDYAENNSTIGALRNYGNTRNIYYPQGFANLGTFDINANQQPYRNKKGGGLSAQLDQDVGFGSLVNTVAYRQDSIRNGFDVDTGPQPILAVLTHSADTQFTEELQLLSRTGSSWRWATGLYYYHATNGNVPGNTYFGGPAVNPKTNITMNSNNSIETTDSVAGYGQVTKEVLPKTDLTIGVRYTYEQRSVDSESVGLINNVTPGTPTVIDASGTSNIPTWRVALEHKFTDDVMAYVSDSRGFKSGGYNLSNGDAPYSPEKLAAYEIGLKTQFLGHRLTLNSSLFYYDYKNIQVSRFANGQALIYNGAAATTYGLDLDVTAAVTTGLTVRAGIELIRDYFNSFPNADHFLTCPAGPTGVCSLSATGNQLPQTPTASGTLNVDYRQPLTHDRGALNYNLNALITSSYYYAPDNELSQPGYGLLNGSILWTSGHDGYSVRLWGKNLTDKIYALNVNQSPGATAASYAAPRTYGITVGKKF
ncbi:MAG: iron complex outerrane recepter protein [Gammaproteobacteria bacterium]|jgi:iron complex outermembrane receptor protein|nr:iron complex outerrane recepter protein [Gammaproteobacteria bacterium]